VKRFDRKFGATFIEEAPTTPGVYLFKDDEGSVLYVGKAKNLRRRLASYRNASRRKAHRKMRTLVREAAALEVRMVVTEAAALTTENELIRTLRPPYNVDGAFFFLYPAIGVVRRPRHTLLCFATDIDAFSELDFRWFGVFRSRSRAKDAFEVLVTLLGLVAHLDKRAAVEDVPSVVGSRTVAFRMLDADIVTGLESFLAGVGPSGLGPLVRALVEKPRARREASEVQTNLRRLSSFHRTDLAKLNAALRVEGRPGTFVSQSERDALFIRVKALRAEGAAAVTATGKRRPRGRRPGP